MHTDPTMAKSLDCHFVIASTLDTKASMPEKTILQKDNDRYLISYIITIVNVTCESKGEVKR